MGLVASRCLAFIALAWCGLALAQPVCQVTDPELQRTYTGGCKDGVAHGLGEAQGTAQYRGEFVAGVPHGKGVKVWPGGDRYEGEFIEGRKHGTGMYLWGRRSPWAGQRYTGGYSRDARHGYGVYEWPGGERYAGPWENDRVAGAPTRSMIARSRAHAELAAAVGRTGAKVCREFEVGVGTRDVVRGTVTGLAGDVINVRIDDPGKFEHVVGDTIAKKGAIVVEALNAWRPCV